jgi:hypothetical protein
MPTTATIATLSTYTSKWCSLIQICRRDVPKSFFAVVLMSSAGTILLWKMSNLEIGAVCGHRDVSGS